MYARVATWEGGDAEAMRANAAGIEAQAADGPPPGLPATGMTMLLDGDNGKALGIVFFATEEDMRQGDATLNTMSPPNDGMGTRTSVEFYEVAVNLDV